MFAAVSLIRAQDLEPPNASRQIVVVATRGWDDSSGTLRRFARSGTREPWRAVAPAIAVKIGRAGLAWGRGIHGAPSFGPQKIEGDGKAPAGVFHLTAAFGHGEKPAGVALPYIHLRADTEAVDDPRSRYYNRIVDRTRIARPDWRSSEKMRAFGEAYRLGIVVAHNSHAVPHAGSCIFLHVWKTPREATSGCTTMPLGTVAELQRWLTPKSNPVLIQAPRAFLPATLREAL